MGFSNADQDKTSSLIRLGRDLRNGGKKQDCQKKILELSLFVLFPFLYRGNFLRMKTTTLCNSFFWPLPDKIRIVFLSVNEPNIFRKVHSTVSCSELDL